jgi:CubicO group peptidase (beta-lactamase class C family)
VAQQLDPRRLDRAFQLVAESVRSGRAPYAALAVGRTSGAIRVTAFGPAGELDPAPRSAIASITKPITAVAIMQLVEAGRLDLSEPIRTYLPWFEPPAPPGAADDAAGLSPITTWHVLTHTAGLSDAPWIDKGDPNVGDREAVLRYLGETPLLWPPGTAYRYASESFYLLAALIGALGDEPFREHLQHRLFEPLNMTATTFDPREPGPVPAWLGGGRPDHGPDDETLARMVRLAMPGGGLWSTPGDVLRFGLALLHGGALDGARILGRPFVEMATRHHTTDVWEHGSPPRRPTYGLGFGLLESSRALPAGRGAFGHSGASGSLLVVDPERDLVVVHLRDEWGATMQLTHEAVAAVYGALP